MIEEQAPYGNPEEEAEESGQRPDYALKGVMVKAKKAMLRNALVKVKEGKRLTIKETELIEEAERDAAQSVRLSGEQEFKNLLEVSEWLEETGWKLSKSTLYKHAKEGRLRPGDDGRFTAKAVEKYAIQWLHKKTDSEKVRAERLAEEERREKIRYQTALRKKMELQLAILEGKYVPKDRMYLELAARAAVLDTGLRAQVQLRADSWLSVGEGNQGRIAEFTRAILQDMEELVNAFATTKQFQVMFRAEEGHAERKRDEAEEDGAAE